LEYETTLQATVTMAAGSRSAWFNLIPGAVSIEEILNSLVVEGQRARLDSIRVDGMWFISKPNFVLAEVRLFVSSSGVGADQNALAANPNYQSAVEAGFGDEAASQIVARSNPCFTNVAAAAPVCYFKSVGELQVPQKWRDLGVCMSDEHAPAAGNRSWLYGLCLRPHTEAGDTSMLWTGTVTLRYSVEYYNRRISRLLEGIE
jgi:hypothetical protein